jgi:transcription elongation factor Elf1
MDHKENNNEIREITQEELDKIVGGYIPDRPRMQQQLQKTAGINCPYCGNIIPTTIQQLLFSRVLFCPTCGLHLNIDKKKSEKALKILEKVDEAMRRVDK